MRPERRLLRRVQLLAAGCLVTGAVIILHLPAPGLLRAALLGAWLYLSHAELARWSRAAFGLQRLEVGHDGVLSGLDANGISSRLLLQPGSLVGRRYAWLRLRRPGEAVFGLPLAAAALPGTDWRRLRVVLLAGRW